MQVDMGCLRPMIRRSIQVMSTTEEKQQSLTPEQFPFTAPQLMNRYVTDTGKILPRKYTGLSARQQRAVTRTIKQSRNTLLAL
jgi:small subunit ribosomal protein S18